MTPQTPQPASSARPALHVPRSTDRIAEMVAEITPVIIDGDDQDTEQRFHVQSAMIMIAAGVVLHLLESYRIRAHVR